MYSNIIRGMYTFTPATLRRLGRVDWALIQFRCVLTVEVYIIYTVRVKRRTPRGNIFNVVFLSFDGKKKVKKHQPLTKYLNF